MFEVLASIIYFPSIFVNLIGLFFGFVAVLNFSSFSIIHAAENFVFNRYSAITRRIHLPKHRTPREFTPSVCFMGGEFSFCNSRRVLSHYHVGAELFNDSL